MRNHELMKLIEDIERISGYEYSHNMCGENNFARTQLQLKGVVKQAKAKAEARGDEAVLSRVILSLYCSEINSGMQTFWDNGFTVWLGDEMNGKRVEKNFYVNELAEAAEWLENQAINFYPDSMFATMHKPREETQS